jgi:gas vesicle protein
MANNTGKFLLGFWIGALAGAGAALLLAPRSGQETIQQLQEMGTELKNQVQTQAQQAEERGRTALTEGVKKTQSALDAAQQKLAKPDDVKLGDVKTDDLNGTTVAG